MTIKAIETQYNGYRFRSRLEARWAVFFDAMGIEWTYEPEGFDIDGVWYLPDFFFHKFGCYAEVKPEQFTQEQFSLCYALEDGCILLDGIPEPKFYYCTRSGFWDKSTCSDEYRKYTSNDIYGRILFEWSVYKDRLWYSFGEGIDCYILDETFSAIEKSKSARFEHGEHP